MQPLPFTGATFAHNPPPHGAVIVFDVCPPASYCTPGQAYRVEHLREGEDFRFVRAETYGTAGEIATFDSPRLVRLARWHMASSEEIAAGGMSRASLLRVAARLVRDVETMWPKAETGESIAALCAVESRALSIFAATAPTVAEYDALDVPATWRRTFA